MAVSETAAGKRLFPLLAVLLAALTTLGLLELTAWALLHKKWPRTPPIPTNEWVVLTGHGKRLRPNLDFTQWFLVSNQVVHFQTNSLGIRGREISLPKTAGVTRVLVLGDSITLSPFLPEEEVFPARVQQMLSASRLVEVINAGVSDMGMKEELLLLKETGLRLKPDLVLIGFYLNDSRPPWGFENEYYRLSPRLIEFSKTVEQYSYLYKWVWKRLLVSHFLGRKARNRWDWRNEFVNGDWRTDSSSYQRVIQGADLDFGAAWQQESWKAIDQGLAQFQDLARENNFKLAILIFPVAVQVKSLVADDYPQQQLKKLCETRNIPCLDLLPILKQHQGEDIYFDHCHLNALGHQIISRHIADFLAPLIAPARDEQTGTRSEK